MSVATVTTAQLLGMIHSDLNAWAKGRRCDACELIHNPFSLVEKLSQTPSGWRLMMHWENDRPAGNTSGPVSGAPVLEHTIVFIFQGDLGPTAQPNINLVAATAARTHPFLELKDALCFRVESYRFPWLSATNNRLLYLGCDDKLPLPDGRLLAAYNVRYALRAPRAVPGNADLIELVPAQN